MQPSLPPVPTHPPAPVARRSHPSVPPTPMWRSSVAALAHCGHTALARMQMFEESLAEQEEQVAKLEGSHHAKLTRKETSRLLGRNSGLAHKGIVDNGGKMQARHEDGLLVVSAADMSKATRTTLGASSDASGNAMARR